MCDGKDDANINKGSKMKWIVDFGGGGEMTRGGGGGIHTLAKKAQRACAAEDQDHTISFSSFSILVPVKVIICCRLRKHGRRAQERRPRGKAGEKWKGETLALAALASHHSGQGWGEGHPFCVHLVPRPSHSHLTRRAESGGGGERVADGDWWVCGGCEGREGGGGDVRWEG